MSTYRKSGFTLVEILIVVIILGILAAIVIPQFTNASTDARNNSLTSQLQTLRSQIELYKLQHRDSVPKLVTGGSGVWKVFTSKTKEDGTVDETGAFGPYMQNAPVNPINGATAVAAAEGANVGWVYDETTGEIRATDKDFKKDAAH